MSRLNGSNVVVENKEETIMTVQSIKNATSKVSNMAQLKEVIYRLYNTIGVKAIYHAELSEEVIKNLPVEVEDYEDFCVLPYSKDCRHIGFAIQGIYYYEESDSYFTHIVKYVKW